MSQNGSRLEGGKPELWPEELWLALARLVKRRATGQVAPRLKITARLCPEYALLTGDNHTPFNGGLEALGEILEVRWAPNRSYARWIRLKDGAGEELECLLHEYRPELLLHPEDDVPKITGWDRKVIEELAAQFGPLGLRTAAHLAFGDSHALDAWEPDVPGIWWQADAGVKGVNIVRCAGRLQLRTPSATYLDCWERPGHYLWEWEIERIDTESLLVGDEIWLVENPYLMWELLSVWRGRDKTLVCLHGHTNWSDESQDDVALPFLLSLIGTQFPGKEFRIWCDPDPAGLVIASRTARLVEAQGGRAEFYRMDERVLADIEGLVRAEQKLKPITTIDMQILQNQFIDPRLSTLKMEIESRKLKGEQEGLVLLERRRGIVSTSFESGLPDIG